MRTIEPPGVLPLRQGQWLAGRGPFGVEDELALLRAHAIDVLVTKASGGARPTPSWPRRGSSGCLWSWSGDRRRRPARWSTSVEAALAWLERAA